MPAELSKNARIASWTAQIIVAVILLQTLFFKFTGAPESVYIFETLGAEPFGRIGSGVIELFASLLLLHRRTAAFGALVSVGTIIGAIGAHLTVLGVEVQGDGGLLFAMAWVVFFGSLTVLGIRRGDVFDAADRLKLAIGRA